MWLDHDTADIARSYTHLPSYGPSVPPTYTTTSDGVAPAVSRGRVAGVDPQAQLATSPEQLRAWWVDWQDDTAHAKYWHVQRTILQWKLRER